MNLPIKFVVVAGVMLVMNIIFAQLAMAEIQAPVKADPLSKVVACAILAIPMAVIAIWMVFILTEEKV